MRLGYFMGHSRSLPIHPLLGTGSLLKLSSLDLSTWCHDHAAIVRLSGYWRHLGHSGVLGISAHWQVLVESLRQLSAKEALGEQAI